MRPTWLRAWIGLSRVALGTALILTLVAGGMWVRSYTMYTELSYGRGRSVYCLALERGRLTLLYDVYPRIIKAECGVGWNSRPAYRGPSILPPTSVANYLGFYVFSSNYRDGASYGSNFSLTLPAWLAWLVPAGPIAIAVISLRLKRTKHSGTRCSACGYDVRASPGLCPECGAPRKRASQ